jgi:hypothetical protein
MVIFDFTQIEETDFESNGSSNFLLHYLNHLFWLLFPYIAFRTYYIARQLHVIPQPYDQIIIKPNETKPNQTKPTQLN